LKVLEIKPYGGLATFLAHQVSTLVLGSAWGMRVVREVAYQVNRVAIVYPALWMDRIVDRRRLFPVGYAMAAEKPARRNLDYQDSPGSDPFDAV
jgi:hypothetical protein